MSASVSTTKTTPSDQPTGASNRIVSLDFIRGIAVVGIVIANIIAFGQPLIAAVWPPAFGVDPGAGSNAMWLAQFVLIDGKMRGLFTVLFGAGLMLFMERAWARGDTRWLQVRRLCWLGLFGAAHFFLLWQGDILFIYALWGLPALLMIKRSVKGKLVTALVLYLGFGILITAAAGAQYLATINPAVAEIVTTGPDDEVFQFEEIEKANASDDIAFYQETPYADIVATTVSEDGLTFLGESFVGILETLPLMLIGMALFQLGWFSGGIDPAKLKRIGWYGVLIGSALTIPLGIWAVAENYSFVLVLFTAQGPGQLVRLPVIIGLLALLIAWTPAAVQSPLGQRFVAAGRMAFTNYLGTSFVMVFVFHGWALGLFGALNRIQLYGVAAIICALILLWSKPWLERFRYGPLEWLWRCLTYGKLFPLKR